MFLVIVDAWALVWLFVYAHWFSKLRLGESTRAWPDMNDTPHAYIGLTRIEGDVMHRAARKGLRSVATNLLIILIALTEWFPTKRPLSTWQTVFVGENILICFLLVVLMARLEKIRRLYRHSEQPAFVAQQ